MDKINDVLDYKSLDIRENILLLNNADLSDEDKKTIINDLPKQITELLDKAQELLNLYQNLKNDTLS